MKFSTDQFDENQIARIAAELYSLEGKITALPGESDLNYKITTDNKSNLLKISLADQRLDYLEFQNALLEHIAVAEIENKVEMLADLQDNKISKTLDANGNPIYVRLLNWIDGRLWSSVNPVTDCLRYELGKQAGAIANALQHFDHPVAHLHNDWNLASSLWTEKYLNLFEDRKKEQVVRFQIRFANIQNVYNRLRKSVIHGDINDNNIVVNEDCLAPRINGIIDFGDANFSQTVNELAIALAYVIMDQADPVAAALPVIKGFNSEVRLSDDELSCLYDLVGMRLVTSVTKSAINQVDRPDNKYLLISQQPAWQALECWSNVNSEFANCRFREACDLTPHPNERLFKDWSVKNCRSVRKLFPTLDCQSVQPVDMSVGSNWLGHESDYNDLAFTEFKLSRLQNQFPESLIAGGYLETRPFYSTDAFEKKGNIGPEYRTVHLGVDFWVPAETPIHAFMNSVVFSVHNNSNHKDYGPTVILRHSLNEENDYFTLYGHLSTQSLQLFKPGDQLNEGELVGYVGNHSENGNWAPHLHFQVILSMLDNEHDFPGVAFPDEAATWKSLCPNPAHLFGELDATVSKPVSINTLLSTRQQNLGKSLSVSYDQPLHIVRGSDVHLIDDSGRKYLDTVNNVAHVGHEHPRIVKAAQNQIAVLNTNTRYLNSAISEFAEELLQTLPSDLSVVHVVNSGSEANELALRMAKTATGRNDFIAVEIGYHGNTNACVDVSSYKFDGKGGAGAPSTTHVVPLPDTFRGRYTGKDAGQKYARHIDQQIEKIQSNGHGIAGFICESIISCGGQIELPNGYLESAYHSVRSAGGICIADEVQTGCGRVGSHFWAFELHQVIPDIVTIGKPIGNGHPLGVVVCTRKIANQFANGMEYFNTFGGNPVSSTIGLEVLRVIKDEGLQERALTVGSQLKSALYELSENYRIIQDVRGQGLFIGFELVDSKKNPLPQQASYLVNRMRQRGVLMSTDGKDHNAIKIKPPMTFGINHVNFLIENLEKVLREDFLAIG